MNVFCTDSEDSNSLNLSVTVNNKTTLPCRTATGNSVRWFFRRSPGSPLAEIYDGGMVSEAWKSRMMIGSVQSGDFNLVIWPVLTTDSGLYYCLKDDQNQPIHFTNLTVLAGSYCSVRTRLTSLGVIMAICFPKVSSYHRCNKATKNLKKKR